MHHATDMDMYRHTHMSMSVSMPMPMPHVHVYAHALLDVSMFMSMHCWACACACACACTADTPTHRAPLPRSLGKSRGMRWAVEDGSGGGLAGIHGNWRAPFPQSEAKKKPLIPGGGFGNKSGTPIPNRF